MPKSLMFETLHLQYARNTGPVDSGPPRQATRLELDEVERGTPMQRPRDDTMRRIRELIEEAEVQIIISRELCEETHNLRQANLELRELLRENLLTNFTKREHWTDT